MSNYIGIDVGEVRVGIAIARGDTKIANPLTTLAMQSDDFWDKLLEIIKSNDIAEIIVGLPRGLDGQDTKQTQIVRLFGDKLSVKFTLPIIWQDEAMTSVRAKQLLAGQKRPANKSDVDSLAASLILTDYLEQIRKNS